MKPDDMFPVLVVGGGLAGLTAAVHLAAAGLPPLLLEADALWPGGRLAGGEPDCFVHEGREWCFRPEHGMHALWGGYANLRASIERFLPDLVLQPSYGEEWINRWGREVRYIEAGSAVRSRWLPAPFHYLQLLFHPHIWASITPLDFLSLPGFLNSILLTVGLDPLREKRALDGLNMREYFRGWTPNLRATFTGLGQNLLAAPAAEIDLAAFIAALRFYTVLRRDSWQMHYLPADAHSSLVGPLAARIEAEGGQVRCGFTALRLEQVDGGWRVVAEDGVGGGLRSFYARQVLLAVQPDAAKRLLLAGPDTAPAASTMVFPGSLRSVVVRLWFAQSPREGTAGGMFTGDFVPDNFFWLHRLYDDARAWHEATGGSVVELHFYGEDALMEQPERHLMIVAIDEIQRAFPELRGSFVHGVVRRNSKTHPRFRVPTDESLFVDTPWPGLYACGDWVGYDTPSFWMERSAVTGIAAANRALSAEGLPTWALLPPPPPELLVRLLQGGIGLLRRLLGPPLVWLLRTLRGRS